MKSHDSFASLGHRFAGAAQKWPQRPALWVDKQTYNYEHLARLAGGLAAAINQYQSQDYPLAAMLGLRSLWAYAGVLGILSAGKGYVPLHPDFPPERTRRMLELSGVNTVVVAKEGLEALEPVLEGFDRPLTLIFPDQDPGPELSGRFAGHQVIGAPQVARHLGIPLPPPVDPDRCAYLLFTSGSTGLPKGVPVSQGNVTSYVDYVAGRYQVDENDRFSQTFDLTFDLSVHDMFVAWNQGACLYSLPQRSLMGPARFIRDHELTMWFSVPSVVMFMTQMRMLKQDSLPSLRVSLFCGEPLPATAATAWQAAAPQCRLENLYGPTEATIAISYYPWDSERSPDECEMGVVPIGWMFEGQEGRVAAPDGSALAPGQAGELLLAGSQVTGGYLNNPEKTAAQFLRLDEDPGVLWYRTGDLVRRRPSDGCLFFLGRVDNQVQVRGHRVELQEVDHALRTASGSDLAVSVAWPVGSPNVEALYGFVAGGKRAEGELLTHCKAMLPEYMVPARVFFLEQMPLNVNGKIDRKAVGEMLKDRLNDAR